MTWMDAWSFQTGAVRKADLAYVAMTVDELTAADYPHTDILEWDAGTWRDGGRMLWPAAGMCITTGPLHQMCTVSVDGHALFLGSGDRHEERLTDAEDDPVRRIRGVRSVAGSVLAVGMDRQAFRRGPAGAWERIDAGARPGSTDDGVVGFEAVDGFSATEIYSVGWNGEIWGFDGCLWTRLPSPTDRVLTGIRCAGDGVAYATGRAGLLVRGRGRTWTRVPTAPLLDDIWSAEWFDGRLYLATMHALYAYDGSVVSIVDTSSTGAVTFYHLSAADGVLWSIGPKDVIAFDGLVWSRID